MNDVAGSLIPRDVEGRARPHKWLGVAFGRRFFLLLGIGLVWSVPAFADARLGYAMIAWDALLVVAWIVDLVQAGRVGPILVRRAWRAPAGSPGAEASASCTTLADSSAMANECPSPR